MPSTVTRRKRKSIHIAKPRVRKRAKSRIKSFHETLKHLNQDFSLLFKQKKMAKDIRLLRRIALNLKHLYFDAKRLKHFPKYHDSAEYILITLTTPWGAPFVLETTLLEAADTFGEQDPKHSDLQKWLSKISAYGHHFPDQILSLIND